MKHLKFTKFLILPIVVFLLASCESKSICEEGNTGSIVVENKRTKGNINVYFNPSRIGSNTPGDLVIKPGEKGSTELPAGVHNVLVRLIISECNGSRCSVSSSTLDEKDIDLSACESLNMAY